MALQLRGFGVSGTDATRLAVRGFSVAGPGITQLALGDFSIGGIVPSLVASDPTPESGQRVQIVYSGAAGAVTWRQVSGPVAVLTPSGANCTAVMPILVDIQSVVIGAAIAGQPELTIQLDVQAAVQYIYDTASSRRPVATYYYL